MTRRAPHGELSPMHGSALRAARHRLRMTQAELGHALGVSSTEIHRKESGLRPITKVQVLAIECLLRRANEWP